MRGGAIGACGITGSTGVGDGVGVGVGGVTTTASAVRAEADDDGSDVPIRLVALTVNVYVVASDKPVMVQLVVVVVQLLPPCSVTVYPVIALPPSETGALHEITDCLSPFADAVRFVGASGFE